MKISIITPSLNSAQYIERAIKSVMTQEYKNFEHIIVDGLSTDNTLEILEKYPHIKWISEKDSGQSNAMNKGFNMSTGDIIVYLNADDYFLPGTFDAVLPHFRNGEKFVVGDVYMILLDGKKVKVIPKVEHKDILHHWYHWENMDDGSFVSTFPNNPVQYFYLREVQTAIPFNENNHFSMDLEFLMNASSLYTFLKIDRVLGIYTLYDNAKFIKAAKDIYHFWTFENFSYIDDFIANWSDSKKRLFKSDQQKGYLKHALDTCIQQQDERIRELEAELIRRDDDIKELKDVLSLTKRDLNELLNAIDAIVHTKAKYHPIDKYKAYKRMLNLFYDKI